MDTNLAKQIAISLLEKHGLIERGWRFEFNFAKLRLGVCKHRAKVIGLSKHYTELNEEKRIRNTILHEIAHALVGAGHGHDEVWRAKAIEIGCDGERCCDADDLQRPIGNYIATCKNGHVRYKFKKPTRDSSCGSCSRTFDPNNLTVWTRI